MIAATGDSPLPAADADMIWHHARILTVDKNFSIVEAVAVKNGRIIAVGSSADVLRVERGSHSTVVDLQGATVLPGLFDSHVHPFEAALTELPGPVPTIDSFDAIVSYIRQQAAHTPPGAWIVVPRTFPTRLKELRMPTRELLDAERDHPVLFDASYVVVVNSRGLEKSGITRDTPNPPAGEIVKDANGEPNGILKNARALLKGLDRNQSFSEQEMLGGFESMLHAYVAAGLTSIGDGAVQAEEIRLYRRLQKENRLPLRVTMTAWYDAGRPLEDLQRAIRGAPYKTNDGDDWLRFGAFKVNVDGGMTIGTAYQRAPYGPFGAQLYGKTDPSDRGQLFESPEKLLVILRTARDAGWQLTAHAQGGGAVDGFLQAIDELNRERPIAPMRPHLIHASFQSKQALLEMKELGVLADVQPAWLLLDSAALEKVFGYDGLRYFFPLRSYIDAGIKPAGGSDHMIGSDKNRATNPYNPFLGMWTAVTRLNTANKVIHPEERISREEALRMYTIWAAYRQFVEQSRGSIEPGKLADLVVVDRDYLSCPEDELRRIEPVTVIINGRIAYQRSSN